MVSSRQIALEAIRKKLIGKKLSYHEYYAIIDQIAHGDVGDIITTYFAAAGFSAGFSNPELYYLTKAMVETGKKLKFKGIVADKHSVGGVPGYRTTPVVVPIIAAAGLKIPKTSSRAITSPAGTADVMETITRVDYSPTEIKKIVEKIGGCLVWGGTVHLAPADDELIEVGRALSFESYDKIVASVMAKKIAAGATHLVIDIPYGRQAKVKKKSDAEQLGKKFLYISYRFKIKTAVVKTLLDHPISQGIGPILEARDCLRILQQKPNRSLEAEARSLLLAETLLELCGKSKQLAQELLFKGIAWQKMQAIIKAQEGDPNIDSEDLKPAKMRLSVKSKKNGVIKGFVNKNLIRLCRLLGTPKDKGAGVYLRKKRNEKVKKSEVLFDYYSSVQSRLEKAEKWLTKGCEIYIIK